MSLYHLTRKNISRKNGSHSTATLAYITGTQVHDDRTGLDFDYSRKERVIESDTVLPEGAPQNYQNPEILFNAIEQYSNRADCRPAVSIEMALQKELSISDNEKILRDWINVNLTSKGYAATYAIHEDPKNPDNIHAHVLIPNRPIKNGRFYSHTTSQYVLDENGNRIPKIDKHTGKQKVDSRNRKQWKRETITDNYLDHQDWLESARTSWAALVNENLPDYLHISEKSYADQGLDQIPTIHEGWYHDSEERHQYNTQVHESNKNIAIWKQAIEALERLIERIRYDSIFNRAISAINHSINNAAGTSERRNRQSEVAELDPDIAESIAQLSSATQRRNNERQRAEAERIAKERRSAELEKQRAERERREAEKQREEAPSRSRGMSM